MTLLSPVAAIPYPALTDAPNMQTAMATMTSSLDSMVVPRYSTLAILTAAVPTPVTGQQVFLTGSNAYVYWNGTAWVASGAALIARVTIAVAGPSITFASIPQIFTNLQLVGSAQCSNNASTAALVLLKFNGDSSAIYNAVDQSATGAATLTMSSVGTAAVTTGINFARIPGSSVGANTANSCVSTISNYSSTTQTKGVAGLSIGGSTQSYLAYGGGAWNSTNAVTSLALTINGAFNFAVGSTFSLYGMP